MNDPDSVKLHLATLRQSRESGDTPNALRAANALRLVDPSNRKVLSVLFELHCETRDWPPAILQCKRLAVLDPGIATDWLPIATIERHSSPRKDSLEYAKRAFVAQPNARDIQISFAGMLLERNDVDQDGIDEIDRVLRTTEATDAHATMIRARARHRAGRNREAVQIIADFLDQGGEPSANLLTHLASYLACAGRFEDARRAFLASAACHRADPAGSVDLLDSAARAAALSRRIPSPRGIKLPVLEAHRRTIRSDAACHLVIFIRHFIDLDHFTPVVAEWVRQSGFFATVVIANTDLPETDFRLCFLASRPRLQIVRLQDLAPTEETDMIFEDIARRIIVHGRKTVACADGSEEFVYREFGQAFAGFNVPFLGLPHGEGAVLNLLQRTDLLTFDDLAKRTVEPFYNGYIFSNRFAHKQWLSVAPIDGPTTTDIVGSARYSHRWVNELDSLPYPCPSLPNDASLHVVLFLIDSIYNVWDAEMARTIDAILSIDGLRLILHDHPRRHLRADDRRRFAMTADSLASNCCSPDRVTIVSGTIPGMALIRAADVFLSLGSSIVIEAVRRNRPALELSYLHANKTLVAQELPECDIRCRDDLLVALADFAARKSKGLELNTFYNEAGRRRFLSDLLDAGHEDPLNEQVCRISERADIAGLAREDFERSFQLPAIKERGLSPAARLEFLNRGFVIHLGEYWVSLPSTGGSRPIVMLGTLTTLDVLSDIARRICLPDWTVLSLEDVWGTVGTSTEVALPDAEIWFSMADFPMLRQFIGDARLAQFLPRLRLVEFFTAAPPAVDKWIENLVKAYGKGIGSVEPNRLRGELDLLMQLVAGRTSLTAEDEALESLRPLSGVLGDLAFTYLALGDLNRGWWLYEASKKRELREGVHPFPQPMWRGDCLRNRTIILWRNQGPGDEILYANAFPDVIAAA